MKIAIEIFTMTIAVTISCILFASIISSNNQCMDARDYYNVVVNRIEDSNCNEQIVTECIEEAEGKGYVLDITDVTVYEEKPSMMVRLKYMVNFPVFGMFGSNHKKEAVIEGYAR